MASIVPAEWLPDARMKRVICHWTAGGYEASGLDRHHYHIMIERDGTLVRGTHSIADNANTADGNYAAHTLGCNSGSIGVAVCCMANAVEQPFDPGHFPMKQLQWRTLAQVVAQLCKRYNIEIGPMTVLGHGEVQRNLGKHQRGKWDPMVLPWNPDMGRREVGDAFRDLVSSVAAGEEDTSPGNIDVNLNNAPLPGSVSSNEEGFIKLSSLVAALGGSIVGADEDTVVIAPAGSGSPISLQYVTMPDQEFDDDTPETEIVDGLKDRGYVRVIDFAVALQLSIGVDPQSGNVDLKHPPAGGPAALQNVVVRAGDTLYGLAARYLRDGNRWQEIKRRDGTGFTERQARRLRPGETVVLPMVVPAPPGPAPVPGPAPAPGPAPGPAPAPEPGPEPTPPDDDLIDGLIAVVPSDLRRFARESIPVILAECRSAGIVHPGQIAYILATSEHESVAGKFMREIWGPTPRQRGYEGRRDLGNNQRGDGFRFRGRGYVQITGRFNYGKWSEKLTLPLVEQPDIVARNPAVAAKILVAGMRDGSFRPPHNLARHIKDAQLDFFNAREIINGDKGINGTRIALIAQRYLGAFA